jgi:nitroimidazol reductase NimA-like FMN-containing flavoprotein (pyridoxamine 5'-phosphate oxidase superfamily)
MQEPKLHVLDREECLRLLTSVRFGRLAVRMHDGMPAIRPVNYVFDHHSQSVVFRTARGSNLHGWLMDGPAAFEVDGVDVSAHSGWSVIVSGVSEEVHSPAEIDRLEALGVLPWAPEQKPLFVRLRAFTVSGRRLHGGPVPAGSERR